MKRRRTKVVWGLVVAILGGGLAAYFVLPRLGRKKDPEWSPVRSIPDSPLPRTVVLATLDEPLPEGKNAVWCASFQMAWDKLRIDVVRGPVDVKGAEALSANLNRTPFDAANLESRDFYASAGWTRDGIVERIRQEMKQAFPEEAGLIPGAEGAAAVAYAFLRASVRFRIPYFENRQPLPFKDSNGRERPVTSFGIRPEDDYAYGHMRRQVVPLYWSDDGGPLQEFALDLDGGSTPYQVIVARVDAKKTMAGTLADLDLKIEACKKKWNSHFGPNEVFLVPNIQFDITHRFRELEGPDKPIASPGMEGQFIGLAEQRILFRLDRSGAEVKSEAKVHVKPIPRYFVCDRPFLVYMKKRGTSQPFIAVWVENPELLQAWR